MQVEGERVRVCRVQVEDVEALLEHHLRNRAFFDPYRPKWPDSMFTLEGMRGRVERLHREWDMDNCYAFHVFLQATGELIGGVDLNFVKRGAGNRALLGYSMDQSCNGKGLMTEAVRLVVGFGFEEAKLHRIEAGVMPRNTGSNRLLEKIGFTLEGLNRKNVRINDVWEDHNMWAMLEEDWFARYGANESRAVEGE